MQISKCFKCTDPFLELHYPSGATGLHLRTCGYWFATDVQGYFYLLRDVMQSMDYNDSHTGEGMCGVTPQFTDTYWRAKTKADLRILLMRLKAGESKKHYENNYTLVRL